MKTETIQIGTTEEILNFLNAQDFEPLGADNTFEKQVAAILLLPNKVGMVYGKTYTPITLDDGRSGQHFNIVKNYVQIYDGLTTLS